MVDFSKEVLSKYADLIWWSFKVTKKEIGTALRKKHAIIIEYDPNSISLANILMNKIREKGFDIIPNFFPTAYLGGVIVYQLDSVNFQKLSSFNFQGSIHEELEKSRNIMGRKAVVFACLPNKAIANTAGLSAEKMINEFTKICFLDKKNPIQAWKKIYTQSKKIQTWLDSLKIKHLHFLSEKSDLKIFSGQHRRWIGFMGLSIPSFEIFFSPDHRYTEGVFYANEKMIHRGESSQGMLIEFKQGVVNNITFEDGIKKNIMNAILGKNNGNLKLGEFALVDKRLSSINMPMGNNILTENLNKNGDLGSCHIALGSAYRPSHINEKKFTLEMAQEFGFNVADIHFDLVNSEDEVVNAFLESGDELTIYKNGQFQIEI